MGDIAKNNQRIAKNTLMLYIRMFFVMLVSLYTVRIVLRVLGEENYGIYNVVGGIVVMFSFISKTLAAASQRYFAFEIGRNDYYKLRQVFSITLVLYTIVILIIVLLAETLGLWYLHNKLVIPDNRLYAAEWVFQLSIISFCITLFATPFQAMIIANERMNIYAFVGIVEVVLKLLLVLLLSKITNVDNLILYAILMLLCHLVVDSIYVIYSTKKLQGSNFHFYWEGKVAKEISSFSGWNLFGAISSVLRSQGINMLIGAFFNPVVNAARGLAYQINNALNSFSHNFYTAVRPQIIKLYAQENQKETINLVFRSSKFTFFLMEFLAVPIIIFINPILVFWLDDVPEYTELFSILVIITALIDSLSHPFMALSQATGRVSLYQSVVGTITIMNLPFSWVLLHYGFPPQSTMYVAIALSIVAMIARVLIIKKLVGISIGQFIVDVISYLVLTSSLIAAISLLIKRFIYDVHPNIILLFASMAISVLFAIGVIYLLGLNKRERAVIWRMVENRIHMLRGK